MVGLLCQTPPQMYLCTINIFLTAIYSKTMIQASGSVFFCEPAFTGNTADVLTVEQCTDLEKCVDTPPKKIWICV